MVIAKDRDQAHPLQEVIKGYLFSLKSLGETVRIVMPHVSKWLLEELKKEQKKLRAYIPRIQEGEENKQVKLKSAHEYADFTAIMKRLDELHSNRSLQVLARSLFVQMFCEFDAFTGALLSAIYIRNDDLLKGIAREISLSDLLEYENIESVKKVMLDKEIETFRRDSYVEQFAQLEKKFGLPLRKFPEWGEFVELGQRRNICTHNNGVVSEQYLVVCDREGWNFPKRPSIGDQLDVPISYLARALVLMSKIGYMLGHTLWSKVFPGETEAVQESLNDNLYSCLEDKRWKTAAELGSFALTDPMRKNVSEINLKIRVINTAIALKFSDNAREACALMKTMDWTASYRDFKLAQAVLEDRFDDAIQFMLLIGKSGELVEQESYHTWPLFHKFRERPEFYETYERIYGVPYTAKVLSDGDGDGDSNSEQVSISASSTVEEKKANSVEIHEPKSGVRKRSPKSAAKAKPEPKVPK